MNISVKQSRINNEGVFAVKDFKKGEVVLRWNPKIIEESQINKLLDGEKNYILKTNDKYLLMQSPEKYVNHSCSPNTYVKNNCDIALKDIKRGEEITSDYTKTKSPVDFECNCGSKYCKKIIKPSS